jgi:hygromycin-B 7''-O-kinase
MATKTLLPTADRPERYQAVRGDHARLQHGANALCKALGLRGVDVVRFPDGSLPVYAVGEQLVLKLLPRGLPGQLPGRAVRAASHPPTPADPHPRG